MSQASNSTTHQQRKPVDRYLSQHNQVQFGQLMPKPNAEVMISEHQSSQNPNMKSQVAPLNTAPYLNNWPSQVHGAASKITNATLYQEEDQNQHNFINIVTDPGIVSPDQSRFSMHDDPTSPKNLPNTLKTKPMVVSMPYQIDIKKTSPQPTAEKTMLIESGEVDDGNDEQTQQQVVTSQVNSANQSTYSVQTDRREPFYSQKQGVDVTKLIQQRKEEITKLQIEQNQVFNQHQHQQQRTSNDSKEMISSGQMIMHKSGRSDQQQQLKQALTITKKSKNLGSIEESQLRLGIEQVLQLIYNPVAAQDQNETPSNVSLEPLRIGYQTQATLPQSIKGNERRSLILTSNGNQNKSFDLQKSQKSQQAIRQRYIAEQTQAVLASLRDDEKHKLVQVFNAVPISLKTQDLIIQFVQDKISQIKQSKQKQELLNIQDDLAKSEEQVQSLANSEFLMSPLSQADGRSYIGNMPLKEPPYTLSYQKEKRERLYRIKHGLPHKATHNIGQISMKTKKNKDFDSQTSLPEVAGKQSTIENEVGGFSKTPRVLTQQNFGDRLKARQKLRNQQSNLQNQSFQEHPQKNGLGATSPLSSELDYTKKRPKALALSVDKQSERDQSMIFSNPKDSISRVRVGSNLLFGQRGAMAATARSQDKQRYSKTKRANNNMQQTLNPKLTNNPLQIEDSIYGTPENNNIKFSQTSNTQQQHHLAFLQTTTANQNNNFNKSFVETNNTIAHDLDIENDQNSSVGGEQHPLVKIQESHQFGHTSKLTKNNLPSGRHQQLYDYQQELISSQINFEGSIESSSLQEDTFLALVHKRDQQLEQIFYKTFKAGRAQQMIPTIMQDIVHSLIDGYKETLVAFGKFSVRQRQQMEYKIDRLKKVQQDMIDAMQQKKVYDEFLKHKMQNLQEEMQRIEGMIEKFNEHTLMGISREAIKDTFSEVSLTLEAIAKDMSTERVALTASAALEDIENPSLKRKKTFATGQKQVVPEKTRVQTFDVMPFSTIKGQIDKNYSEIQSKTTRAVIKRLGLGKKLAEQVNNGCQTEGQFVERSLFSELDLKLFEISESLDQCQKENRTHLASIQEFEEQIERNKAAKQRETVKMQQTKKEMYESQEQVKSLEGKVEDLEEQQFKDKEKLGEFEHQERLLRVQIEKFEVKVKDNERTIEEINADTQKITKKFEDLKESNSGVNQQIIDLQETVATQSQVMGTQSNQLKTLQGENSELYDQIETLRAHLDVTETNLNNSKNEVTKANMRKQSSMNNTFDRDPNQPQIVQQAQLPSAQKASTQKLKHQASRKEPASQNQSGAKGTEIRDFDPAQKSGVPSKHSENTLPVDDQKSLSALSQPKIETQIEIGSLNNRKNDSSQIKEEDSKLQDYKEAKDFDAIAKIAQQDSEQPYDSNPTDSDVSSSEHYDAMHESPLDVIKIRQNLKRQATLCPTKLSVRQTASQTDHSGPILGQIKPMTQNIAAATASEYSQGMIPHRDSHNFEKKSTQPIYQFSYNKQAANDDLNSDLQGMAKTMDLRNSQKLRNGGGDKMNIEEEDVMTGMNLGKKLDKKLLQKGGKIRKGSMYGAKLKNQIQDLNMSLGIGNKITEVVSDSSPSKTLKLSSPNKRSPQQDIFSQTVKGKMFGNQQSNMQDDWFTKGAGQLSVLSTEQPLVRPFLEDNASDYPPGRLAKNSQMDLNFATLADSMTPSRRSTHMPKKMSSLHQKDSDPISVLRLKNSNDSGSKK